MIEIYRLHPSRYLASSGKGAGIYGGRWNPKGVEAIYAAEFRSLAVLEVLVHYSVLPKGFVITPIRIPDGVLNAVVFLKEQDLPVGWDSPTATGQDLGTHFSGNVAAAVPSAIVRAEKIFVMNPRHPSFERLEFQASEAFDFDPRLRGTRMFPGIA